jgi:hypothetical protein
LGIFSFVIRRIRYNSLILSSSVLDLSCFSIRREKTRITWLLLATIVLAFGMSTACYICDCYIVFIQLDKVMLSSFVTLQEQISADQAWVTSQYTWTVGYAENFVALVEVSLCDGKAPGQLGSMYLLIVQFLIGDAIVIWRTWVIWQGSRICYIPMALWLGGLGTY